MVQCDLPCTPDEVGESNREDDETKELVEIASEEDVVHFLFLAEPF